MTPIITATELKEFDAAKITDIVLHTLGKKIQPATILKVGACDGSFDDLTVGWIHGYGMNAIYIEPIPDRCETLRNNVKGFRGKVSIFECAVSNTTSTSTVEMCVIPSEYMGKYTPNGLYVHPALIGMSSVWPPKNGLSGEHDAKVLEEVGKRIHVPVRTIDSILQEAQPESIDLLSIDTEGHDWIVLSQFDFIKYRPYWLEIELCNLSPQDRQSAEGHIRNSGYLLYHSGRDGYALRFDCIDWTK